VLRDGHPLFLTAAHVVGSLSEVAGAEVIRVNYVAGFGGASSQDRLVGEVYYSDPVDPDVDEVALDAALVEPADDVTFGSVVSDVPTSCFARDVEETAGDDNPVIVHKRGFATGFTTGLLEPYESTLEIEGRRPDGSPIVRTYTRGYLVTGDNDEAFAKPGDSGAIVTDADGCIVGMVVAVVAATPNNVHPDDPAFIVPISDLLDALSVRLAGPRRPCTSI